MLTDSQAVMIVRVRQRMALDRTLPNTINEGAAYIRAARAVQRDRITLSAAGREFGISRAAVFDGLRRIKRIEGAAQPASQAAPIAASLPPAPVPIVIGARKSAKAAPAIEKASKLPASSRAALAAQHAHDTPCTRDRAAAMFGVHLDAVVAAWERLYPEIRRVRT